MWYTHDYFYKEGEEGFAAIPLRNLAYHKSFDEKGVVLCEAKLAMHLRGTFISHTSSIKHQKGRFGCPLLLPEPNGEVCPIQHKKWEEGGCTTVIPTAIGARLRYELDRESNKYKEIYAQRTASERIFSRAVALGIERPKLRNKKAIANYNSLIYLVINLRSMKAIDEMEILK